MVSAISKRIDVDFKNRLTEEGRIFHGRFDGESKVAVKVVPVSEEETLDFNERYLINLTHSNVVQLMHVEHAIEFRLYAMETCNASLEHFCRGKYDGAMPDKIHSLYQLTNGLQYLHSKALFHPNIKASNVLISCNSNQPPQLKWSDYWANGGVSCWPAPEQHRATGIQIQHSSQSNVFNLGCLFFYFLEKGTDPFGDPFNGVEDNQEHVSKKLVINPQNFSNGLLLATLISRMTEILPAERIQLLDVLQVLIYNLQFEGDATHRRAQTAKNEDFVIEFIQKKNRNHGTRTMVHLAAMTKDLQGIQTMQHLLESGGDPNALDQFGWTALHLAAQNPSAAAVEIMKQLLIHDANPNKSSIHQLTAVHFAAQNTSQFNAELVRMLLVKGGDPNAVESNGWTPLHVAARNRSQNGWAVVEQLLIHGGHPNAVDYAGASPVHYAAMNNARVALETLKLLLENGGDILLRDESNRLPRHYAESNFCQWTSELSQMLVMKEKRKIFRLVCL